MAETFADKWKNYSRSVLSFGFDPARKDIIAGDADFFADAMRSGEAWDMLCDAMKALGPKLMETEFAGSDQERAEGYRYLLGLLCARLNSVLYAAGPEAPAFVMGMNDVLKIGMDNPDGINSYTCELRPDRDYRIYGQQGQERYVEFIQSGNRGTLTNNYLDQYEVAADGRFEIWLTRERPAGAANWIEMHPETTGMLVRLIQYDWDAENMTRLHIEQPGYDGTPDCLKDADPAEMGYTLGRLARTLGEEADFWLDYTRTFTGFTNHIGPLQALATSGTSNPNRAAPKGWFELAPDEALIVEIDQPQGIAWSICLADVWFRSIDFSHRQTSLNGVQAAVDGDGKCRFVIAHQDPGYANWLDTAGHPRGGMMFRFVRTDRPQSTAKVVRFADLADHLPADSQQVTPDERAETLRARARGVGRRYAVPFTSRWKDF